MDNEIKISTRTLARVAAIVGVAIVALLLVLVLLQQRDTLLGLFGRSPDKDIDKSTYQAVFLANNQVYFGKLATSGGDYFILTEVYYLGDQPTQDQKINQLVKRGSELHKPQDKMIIPVHEVVFIENLRPESEMVDAIRRFKAGETAPPTASARPSASPTR